MAPTSLRSGILLAMVITLFVIPALYLMPDDLRRGVRCLWNLLLNRNERAGSATAECWGLSDSLASHTT